MTDRVNDSPLNNIGFTAGNLDGDGLKTVLVVPDGVVESRNGTFTMDAEAARELIGDFEKHGVEVPIDFEHQTLGGAYSSPDGRAPAAGWITTLWHERGRGLLALVRWNEKTRASIREGAYLYLSPTLSVRKADGRAIALHSAALTNKPAIPRMEKLAASSRFTDTETKPMATEGANIEEVVGQIKKLLNLTGEYADLPAALTAIREAVKELMVDVEAESAVAASVRDALGLPPTAGNEDVVCTLKANYAGGVTATAELAALRERETEREAELLMQPYIQGNKINPNAVEDMRLCRAIAREDPERFKKLMAERRPYVEPGRTKAPPMEYMARSKVIRDAERTYRAEKALQKTTSAVAFVNNALREAALAPLTDAEKLDLVIV